MSVVRCPLTVRLALRLTRWAGTLLAGGAQAYQINWE